MPAPPKSRQKNIKTRSGFCEILSPRPPAFRKISLAFRICISAHHRSPEHLRCAERSPHFWLLARSTTLRVVARKWSGVRLWIFSAVFDKIGSSGVVKTHNTVRPTERLVCEYCLLVKTKKE